MVILHDTLSVYGGSQTLMLRICRWLTQNGIRSAVICRGADNTEIVDKLRAGGTQIIPLDVRDTEAAEALFRRLAAEDSELIVVNFIWSYYMDLERLKHITGLRFSNRVYAIHPDTFKKGGALRFRPLQALVRRSYGKLLRRMNENGAVNSMDEDVLSATEQYFGMTLSPKVPLLPLPMFCPERSDADALMEIGYASDLLMTASRAEYPYKGYLLGLPAVFSALKEKHPSLRLEIVAGGEEEDVALLREKLAALPSEYQKDITFHNWLDYDALRREMERCKVFIGMGTSVLDAALAYKPAVAVRYDTYDVLADGVLSDAPAWITARADCRTPAALFLEQLLSMDEAAYRAACRESFRQVKAHYDIDNTMRLLLASKTRDDGCIMTGEQVFRHHLHTRINQVLGREKAAFSIKNIKKE